MTRLFSRRAMLATGAATSVAALGACRGAPQTSGTDAASLRLAWWGNPTRNEATNTVIGLYTAAHPTVTISGESGEFDSYWKRLATQTAGNDMPDVIQMDMRYIREYGDRGALLDLEKYGLSTTDFAPGTADAGRTDDGLVGINAGVNAPVILANPALFDRAKVDLPDDTSWTWDDLSEVARALSRNSGGKFFGTATSVGGIAGLEFWVRQHGKQLYDANGLAFGADEVLPLFTWLKGLVDSSAAPSPAAITEDEARPLAQKMFATGQVAMASYWSNQVAALDEATQQDLTILHYPSHSGSLGEAQYWFKASMLWSASARSAHPEAAVALIDFLVNGEEAAKVIRAERGMPPNSRVRALIEPDFSSSDKKAAKFLADLEAVVADAPMPPPPGSSGVDDALSRQTSELIFGRTTAEQAAEAFIAESRAELQR